MSKSALKVRPAPEPKTWCLVVSKPFSEKTALENIERQGFEVYLPMAVSPKVDASGEPRGGLNVRPLFPRYLFARIDPSIHGWKRIFNTRGVHQLLTAGERPLMIRDSLIDDIRRQEERDLIAIMPPEHLTGGFARGQSVRVRMGHAEFSAIFEEPVDNKRASILIQLLSGEVSDVVTLSQLF